MANYTILFNPKAGNGHGTEDTKKLNSVLKDDILQYCDITSIKDYKAFFAVLPRENRLLISGGDGTLNRFINDTDGIEIQNDIYYYATGSGNDFLNDLGRKKGDAPFCINPYLKDLPRVTVNGKSYKFLNGIGFGIDGYCCEEGDRQREKSPGKNINYTAIAIKGLSYAYKPTNARVTVDGITREYKKAWLAPTMNGRYYGGGIMPTPGQDRLNNARTVSTMLFYGKGKLKTLMMFPSIFKGEHIKYTDSVAIFTGSNVKVEFDRPTALQIDGETVLGVTEYTVETAAAAKPQEISAAPVTA